MPVDVEMLLSASPPLFSHSAFADFHYAYNHRSMPTNRLDQSNQNVFRIHAFNGKGSTSPIRPILIIKTSPVTEDLPDLESPTSPSGRDKKKVWFADDKGLSLTHVRIMSEPSDCPPRWTESFLEHVTRGAITCGGLKSRRRRPGAVVGPGGDEALQWQVVFPQPASDYVAFRHNLDRNCVSLENVIVRDDGEDPSPLVTGTVKVKNLAYDKRVFVRFTFNRWLDSQDVKCTFVPNGLDGTGAAPQFDTFSFTVVIPAMANKYQAVEFCVCFVCEGKEYWDSHGGTNYKLVLVRPPEMNKPLSPTKETKYSVYPKFLDPVKADFDRWTEFASWNHLINDSPYW